VKRRLSIALVHYPIVDAQGGIVTTAITNLDVHDMARSARTYGCSDYFLVHPIDAQRELVERICTHWREGSSGRRIPARKEALALIRIVPSLDALYEAYGGRDRVEVWITHAREARPCLTFAEGRSRLAGSDDDAKPVVVVFGTGWGLAPSVIEAADEALEPIRVEGTGYNHLSVRAACAITLDRLRG
jgi:hypothetical protein